MTPEHRATYLAILRNARLRVEHSSAFICHALTYAGTELNASAQAQQLIQIVERGVWPAGTLEGWLYHVNGPALRHGQHALARTAWVDKLIDNLDKIILTMEDL